MKKIILLISILQVFLNVSGQTLTQNIRGTVIDKESQVSLPGANVVILDSDPIVGTVSDADGEFTLENVPVGRHTLKITFLGYEDITIPEILVGSAKEIILTIPMSESLQKIQEVVVTGTRTKGDPVNEMATVSARSFTVEETKRYPAGISDPSRMALSFAGVATTEDISNEIVIRGNSPNGLLWRVEGVEVPSPNHFSEEGGSSGYVSILSANMVGKSDFFTGAFPAEYGNAMSGVFDISLRKGNNEKREYAFQFGMMGADLSLEGPFSKNYKGSYLVNYRYSTLSVLDKVGISVVGDMIPAYQDLSMKLSLPTKKLGRFSIWMLGGLSDATVEAETDSLEWEDASRSGNVSEMGSLASGLTHLYFLNDHSWIKSIISYSGGFSRDANSYVTDSLIEEKLWKVDAQSTAIRLSTTYNNKINSRLTVRAGLIGSHIMFSYLAEQRDSIEGPTWAKLVDEEGCTQLLQGYLHAKYRFSDKVTFNTGLHYMYFMLNGNNSIEPRAGISWKLFPTNTLGIGVGIHSRLEQMATYFLQTQRPDGSYYRINEDLGLSKAAHYVISYAKQFTEDLHAKIEVYYQNIFRLPVSVNPESTFSPVNGEMTMDTLVNSGRGKNYGIELTIEKFFTRSYYFLITGSLFDSKYRAADNNWYNTRFDIGYMANIIIGKEFTIGKKKNSLIGINVRFIWSGGKRDTPVDFFESANNGYTVRDLKKRFEWQYEDYLRLDVSASYRINRKKSAHILSFDVQNATNRKNVYTKRYNLEKHEMIPVYQTGLFPTFNYRLEF